MRITGTTRVTGIFGWPVGHSVSPPMQNAAFKALALDYCYVPFAVHPDALSSAVEAIRALNLRGVNITIPHKERVMAHLDTIDAEAAFVGAVNTVVNDGGRLTGYNTDGRGFMQSLAEQAIDLDGKDVFMVGAGGAARAVGYYVVQKARSLVLYGRTMERVERLAEDLRKIGGTVSVSRDAKDLGRYYLIIQATPLGLYDADPLPVDADLLEKGQVVYDLVYKKTKLLREARKRGCVALAGDGMLLWQGALAFELWTGRKPDIDAMRRALRRTLG